MRKLKSRLEPSKGTYLDGLTEKELIYFRWLIRLGQIQAFPRFGTGWITATKHYHPWPNWQYRLKR